jgi:diketogulonate reductase-like aldo/keto reductase
MELDEDGLIEVFGVNNFKKIDIENVVEKWNILI